MNRPPTLLLGASDGSYVPDDPTGAAPQVTVDFVDDVMSVDSPAGRIPARRVG